MHEYLPLSPDVWRLDGEGSPAPQAAVLYRTAPDGRKTQV